MTSPPICAIGRSTLIASRMNLREAHVRSCGRVFDGKSSHQPIPATETVTPRTITTSKIPQPTLETASPTASRPDQVVTATSAAIPINQATAPACLTISAPIPPATSHPHRGDELVGPFELPQLERELRSASVPYQQPPQAVSLSKIRARWVWDRLRKDSA